VKRCTERDKTRLEHTWEIAKAFGLKDFASAESELAARCGRTPGTPATATPRWAA
jgi:hypothetical protein